MEPLPKKTRLLWGKAEEGSDYLLDEIRGDGKEFMWYGYLDDRPWCYVGRVGTGTNAIVDGTDVDAREDVLAWFEDTIMDEALPLVPDELYDDYRADALEDEAVLAFPIPPLVPSGCEWGEYVPTEEDMKIINPIGE